MKSFYNLYKFEIRQNFKSLVLWFISIAVILALFMAIFPSMSKPDFQTIVNAKRDALPKGLIKTVGMDQEMDLQDIFFFFAYMFQYFVIALIIYAINLGSHLVSKEHEEKHIDYLATKPVKKDEIIGAKYLAMFSLILLETILVFVVSFIIIQIYNKTDNSYLPELTRLFTKTFFVYLVFGTLAFFTSAILYRTPRSNMIILSVFFLTYVFGVMSKLVDKVEKLKYLSPYFMFETSKAGTEFSSTDVWYLIVLFGLSLVLFLLAILRYEKKDLSL